MTPDLPDDEMHIPQHKILQTSVRILKKNFGSIFRSVMEKSQVMQWKGKRIFKRTWVG